jgi:hypothetical protein
MVGYSILAPFIHNSIQLGTGVIQVTMSTFAPHLLLISPSQKDSSVTSWGFDSLHDQTLKHLLQGAYASNPPPLRGGRGGFNAT